MIPRKDTGRWVLYGSVLQLLFVGLVGCERKSKQIWSEKPELKVMTSFAPIYCFALNVAGDDAQVKCLLTSKGPHDHGEPTELHLKQAEAADLLLLNGLNIDDSFGQKIKGASTRHELHILALGDLFKPDELLEGECTHLGHEHGDKHEHPIDPHIWLGIDQAKKMVAGIRDELKRLDPPHAANYDSRATIYLHKLDQLKEEGLNLLRDKTERKILAHHDSLQYFTVPFDLHIAGYITNEGVEPGSERLKKIVADCKKYQCRIIAVEPQYPKNSAAATVLATLLKEGIQAEYVEVDPLETAEESQLTPDLYIETMRRNLNNLAKVLR